MLKDDKSCTCCQCVGGSSGAVDRTSASLGFVRLFLKLPFTWLFSITDVDDSTVGTLNSTSNQNAKPCNGAV